MYEDATVQGCFILNHRKRSLSKNGVDIPLTQLEYQIVDYLFKNPGRLIYRNEILTAVWGEAYLGEEKIVDVNIRRLRLKMEDDSSNPAYLKTVWGQGGYKWSV